MFSSRGYIPLAGENDAVNIGRLNGIYNMLHLFAATED